MTAASAHKVVAQLRASAALYAGDASLGPGDDSLLEVDVEALSNEATRYTLAADALDIQTLPQIQSSLAEFGPSWAPVTILPKALALGGQPGGPGG